MLNEDIVNCNQLPLSFFLLTYIFHHYPTTLIKFHYFQPHLEKLTVGALAEFSNWARTQRSYEYV